MISVQPMYPLQSVNLCNRMYTIQIIGCSALLLHWLSQTGGDRDSNLASSLYGQLMSQSIYIVFAQCNQQISKSLVLILELSSDNLPVFFGNKIILCAHYRFWGLTSSAYSVSREPMKISGWILGVSYPRLTFSHHGQSYYHWALKISNYSQFCSVLKI